MDDVIHLMAVNIESSAMKDQARLIADYEVQVAALYGMLEERNERIYRLEDRLRALRDELDNLLELLRLDRAK